MTIKIISRGTPPQEKIYKGHCRECTTTFTFNKSDTILGSERNYTYYSIICPVCNFAIYMTDLNLKEYNPTMDR